MKLLNLLLCLVVFGFPYTASAQGIKTTTKSFEANTVSIAVRIDTIELEDPVTGEWIIRFEKQERIQTLNGRDIYYDNEASEPAGAAVQNDFKSLISRQVNEELKNAKDIHSLDVVIDEKGDLGFARLQFYKNDKDAERRAEPVLKTITEKLKGIHFVPAQRNGKAVPYGASIMVIR